MSPLIKGVRGLFYAGIKKHNPLHPPLLRGTSSNPSYRICGVRHRRLIFGKMFMGKL
jgi:hypothetical protein